MIMQSHMCQGAYTHRSASRLDMQSCLSSVRPSAQPSVPHGCQTMAPCFPSSQLCRAAARPIGSTAQRHRSLLLPCKAATAEAAEAEEASTSEREPEYYEVSLPKPLGVKLQRGQDGAAYVSESNSSRGNTDGQIEVGDKVIKVSASFGSDTWNATNYGQVLYAIKTRSGDVYLQLQKMYGDMSALQADDTQDEERQFKAERRGGNYGANTQVVQAQNYAKRKASEADRKKLFEEALAKFRNSDIEGALVDFENVVSTEPKGYRGDDFSKVTQVYRVAQYNIACCYSTIGQAEAGLEALSKCLQAGFEGYNKIREDPNLAKVRADPGFQPLIEEYDEPVISGEAIKAIKNFFSFGRK